MGVVEGLQILALLLSFIGGAVTEKEVQIVEHYIYFESVDSNITTKNDIILKKDTK